MGLDTTHDAFHGPYSQFMRFRQGLFLAMGGGELREMEGFSVREKGKSWGSWVEHDLYPLINHSDCDGFLTPADCAGIVRGLKDVMPKLSPDNQELAERFMAGAADAAAADEELEFG